MLKAYLGPTRPNFVPLVGLTNLSRPFTLHCGIGFLESTECLFSGHMAKQGFEPRPR